MKLKKSVSKVRFEIWLSPDDVASASRHLLLPGQSLKNYIETHFKRLVAERKKRIKGLFS